MIKHLLLFFSLSILSADPKICLNMIVKDESAVIRRCLESVKPWIDTWVIVDTGSTDGTQEIIRQFLKDIPGELHERPWVNFAHNRNEALTLAKKKGDYLLFIDADETLSGMFDKKKIIDDIYSLQVCIANNPKTSITRAFLINTRLDWQWEGVIHEYLLPPPGLKSVNYLSEMEILAVHKDGARSKNPDKHKKDAEVLEKALIDDPTNSKYIYYLAQSYYQAGDYEKALQNYEKRAKMSGWEMETFWSKYLSGYLQQILGRPAEQFIQSYSNAFTFSPTRIEPLYRLSHYFLSNNCAVLGYTLSKHALTIPSETYNGYMENWIYSYGMLLIHADACYILGHLDEAETTYKEALLKKDLPEDIRPAIDEKIKLCHHNLEKLGKKGS